MHKIEKDFLINLAESTKKQLELQQLLIEQLQMEDEYLSLAEVKELIPGISTHRLNELTRRGLLKVKKVSPRTSLYLRSSLDILLPH